MVVGLVLLWGGNTLINKLDVWLMQHDAPLALKPRPSVVKRLAGDTIEVIEFGSTRWQAIPGFILLGYLFTALIVLLPLLTQSQDPEALGTAMIYILGFLAVLLLITLGIRSRFTYYHIALISGKIQKRVRIFGIPGKVTDYLLKLPVEAHTDCQPKRADLRDSSLHHATCWIPLKGRKIIIIHKDDQEAEQFRNNLIEYGCPIVRPSEDMLNTMGDKLS